tara:strand:+ start:1382 stop:2275 length:894 start_codon:yes stop_codon:yes gene_type:complete
MNENLKFVISGSRGWLSSHFINRLNNLGYSVFEIKNENMWEEAKIASSKGNNKTILIHNAFISPTGNEETNLENYKNKLIKNFKYVEDFIDNVKIGSIFYPSTGRVYYLNSGKTDLYDIYADQKLFEEEKLKFFSKKYNFSLIIARIFSLIGSNEFFNSKSSFQTLIRDSVLKEKLIIKSNTNDLHSISLMDNLIALVISIFLNNNQDPLVQFDVVDDDRTLLNFSELIFQKLKLDPKNLQHSIDLSKNYREYVGSQSEYKKLMQQYVKNPFTLENYLSCVLNDQLHPSELPQFKHL